MDSKEKIALSQYLLTRFDVYTGAVNNKVSFYLTINTFVLGGICLGYTVCKGYPKTATYDVLMVFTILLLLCCFGSIFFTIGSVAPYLTDNHVKDDRPSLIFFGGVARYQCPEFQQKFGAQTDDAIANDFERQVHSIACGLDRKFKQLKWASNLLLLEYALLIIVIFITFLILK